MENLDIFANGQWSLEKSEPEQNQEVIEKSMHEAQEDEVCKVHGNGQWSLEKQSLNYAKINAPNTPKPASPTLDYGKINAVVPKPAGPSLDYNKVNPKPDSSASEANAKTLDYTKINDPKTQKPAWKQTLTEEGKKEAWMKVNRARNELSTRGLKKD